MWRWVSANVLTPQCARVPSFPALRHCDILCYSPDFSPTCTFLHAPNTAVWHTLLHYAEHVLLYIISINIHPTFKFHTFLKSFKFQNQSKTKLILKTFENFSAHPMITKPLGPLVSWLQGWESVLQEGRDGPQIAVSASLACLLQAWDVQCLSLLGCHNKMPQTTGVKQQKFIFSHFWKLEV